jgi:hypothetical protein
LRPLQALVFRAWVALIQVMRALIALTCRTAKRKRRPPPGELTEAALDT